MISDPDDLAFMRMAQAEARAGFEEGGCPIGAVVVRGGKVLGMGRNRRVQNGDPVAHGEMEALRAAGRLPDYRGVTLYTTLSPCMMCAGTIVQFGIPRLVIGENTNFGGNEPFLRDRDVDVTILDDPDCTALMARFIRERPELWWEDIARPLDEAT